MDSETPEGVEVVSEYTVTIVLSEILICRVEANSVEEACKLGHKVWSDGEATEIESDCDITAKED